MNPKIPTWPSLAELPLSPLFMTFLASLSSLLFLEPTKHSPYTCCFFCSFTSFRSLLKCDFYRKVIHKHPIKNNTLPPLIKLIAPHPPYFSSYHLPVPDSHTHLSTYCLPLPTRIVSSMRLSFLLSLHYPQGLDHCLVHNRCSLNHGWMGKFMDGHQKLWRRKMNTAETKKKKKTALGGWQKVPSGAIIM